MSAEPAGAAPTPPKGRARPQAPALDLGGLYELAERLRDAGIGAP